MVVAKKWILKQSFDGVPKLSDFELVEENIPDTLNDGEILCEAIHWTVDPYMRTAEAPNTVGACLFGQQIAKVLASKNKTFPVGSVVRGHLGWRTHSVVTSEALQIAMVSAMPDMGNLPKSLGLGSVGMPGRTAYFGFLELCQPKEGETVLVNGAAGAVGSMVGQIAKIKGCKVIAYAGSDVKCKWLKDELGFDEVFNYKKVDLNETLKKAAPDGIDCYFDNVGGDFTSTALKHMKLFGRVSICGSISVYNDKTPAVGPLPFFTILAKQLKIEGFIVSRWAQRIPEAERALIEWIKEGKMKYRETVTKGFENMPKVFIGLFQGENIGKAIISV